MPQIVHIAVKVEDLDKASEFYEKVFGFTPIETSKVRDHTSRHLSDGAIDIALIKYDSEESAEAKAAGEGPCIHHAPGGTVAEIAPKGRFEKARQ